MNTTSLGVPYKDSFSETNINIVKKTVEQRFPEWATECEPGVNVLTLREWNRRGYRVKKGERGIRLGAMIPVWKEDTEKGEKVQVGHRHGRAFVFALPQVEKKHQ